jgi:serine/threonine protein phosphatase 1
LPFFIETDVAILVHGGLDCRESNPFTAFDKLLWTRDSRGAEKWLRGKKLIHGHTPRLLFQIEEAIEDDAPFINLDNGCVVADDNHEAGNLLCYDIDKKKIIAVQPNVDAVRSR